MAIAWTGRRGLTLVELTVSVLLIALVMGAVTMALDRDTRGLAQMTRKSFVEEQLAIAADRIEQELRYAIAFEPQTLLDGDAGAGDTASLAVLDNEGFPDGGALLVRPGTASEERIGYDGLGLGPDLFLNLERGDECTAPAAHLDGGTVLWSGSAFAIENQINPAAEFFDGQSMEFGGPVFYRGDGWGFVYRRPCDPAGNREYLDALGEVQWGSRVNGVNTLDGWSCLYFEPSTVLTEAQRGSDLNADGDQNDTFELGRLRMRSWNAANPAAQTTDVALCPPVILQEQCARGADLDGDGFEDPVFLWDAETSRLRLRLFYLTSTEATLEPVRSMNVAFFLRNGRIE